MRACTHVHMRTCDVYGDAHASRALSTCDEACASGATSAHNNACMSGTVHMCRGSCTSLTLTWPSGNYPVAW